MGNILPFFLVGGFIILILIASILDSNELKHKNLLKKLRHYDLFIRRNAIAEVKPTLNYLKLSPNDYGGGDEYTQEKLVKYIYSYIEALSPVIFNDSDPENRRLAIEDIRKVENYLPNYSKIVSDKYKIALEELTKVANTPFDRDNKGKRFKDIEEAKRILEDPCYTASVLASFENEVDAFNALKSLPFIRIAIDSNKPISIDIFSSFGIFHLNNGHVEIFVNHISSSMKLIDQTRDILVKHGGICKNESGHKVIKDSPIVGWEIIKGDEAIQLAEMKNVARHGTFSSICIKWNNKEISPFKTINGFLNCKYCGQSTPFSIEGLTATVNCIRCGSTYNLFNSDYEIEKQKINIIVASVYSHAQGSGILLPELNIEDVIINESYDNEDESHVDDSENYGKEDETHDREVLDVWDCNDPEKIKTFIDKGGDINARDDDKWTLLHRAATEDLPNHVWNLLRFGANPNLPVIPGFSKKTLEIVRNNHKPNARKIEEMLLEFMEKTKDII